VTDYVCVAPYIIITRSVFFLSLSTPAHGKWYVLEIQLMYFKITRLFLTIYVVFFK
jgi:hypothetical protein